MKCSSARRWLHDLHRRADDYGELPGAVSRRMAVRPSEVFLEVSDASGVKIVGVLGRCVKFNNFSERRSPMKFQRVIPTGVMFFLAIAGGISMAHGRRAHTGKRACCKHNVGEIYGPSRTSIYTGSATRLDGEGRNVPLGIFRSPPNGGHDFAGRENKYPHRRSFHSSSLFSAESIASRRRSVRFGRASSGTRCAIPHRTRIFRCAYGKARFAKVCTSVTLKQSSLPPIAKPD